MPQYPTYLGSYRPATYIPNDQEIYGQNNRTVYSTYYTCTWNDIQSNQAIPNEYRNTFESCNCRICRAFREGNQNIYKKTKKPKWANIKFKENEGEDEWI